MNLAQQGLIKALVFMMMSVGRAQCVWTYILDVLEQEQFAVKSHSSSSDH